jgi:hypothetical protein
VTKPPRTRRLRAIIGIVIFCALAFVTVRYFVAHRIPPHTLSELRWDMKREDITKRLGPPDETKTYPDGRTRITYSAPFIMCSFDVVFDPSGKITRMFHDHF